MNSIKKFFLLSIGFAFTVSAMAQENKMKTVQAEQTPPEKPVAKPALPESTANEPIPVTGFTNNQEKQINNSNQKQEADAKTDNDKEEAKPQFIANTDNPPKSISTVATDIKDVPNPPALLVDQSSKITTTPPVKKAKSATTPVQQKQDQ